jgi:hypothetical protein
MAMERTPGRSTTPAGVIGDGFGKAADFGVGQAEHAPIKNRLPLGGGCFLRGFEEGEEFGV